MKNISHEVKIDMIKSQLKYFEIFGDNNSKVFVEIPDLIEVGRLSYDGSGLLFYTIEEIENDNS